MKLVLHALHEYGVHVPEITIPVSLGVICAVLVVTTITSLYVSRRAETGEAGRGEVGRGDAEFWHSREQVPVPPGPLSDPGGTGRAS